MAAFVEEFKDYKLLELSAKRHISLASELGRIVKQHGLTTISALEQSLACSNDHANQIKELMRIIEDPNVGGVGDARAVDVEGGRDSPGGAVRAALRAEAGQQAEQRHLRAAGPRHQRRHDQRDPHLHEVKLLRRGHA